MSEHLWATARELDETYPADTRNEAAIMARLALREHATWREATGDPTPEHAKATTRDLDASMTELARQCDAAEARVAEVEAERDHHQARADALRAKHEGGDGAYWAEWHRDHCAGQQAAEEARAERDDLRAAVAALADEWAAGRVRDDLDHPLAPVLRALLDDPAAVLAARDTEQWAQARDDFADEVERRVNKLHGHVHQCEDGNWWNPNESPGAKSARRGPCRTTRAVRDLRDNTRNEADREQLATKPDHASDVLIEGGTHE